MSTHIIPYEFSYFLPSSNYAIFFLRNLSKSSFYHIIHLLHCLKNFFFFVMTTHSTIPLTIYNFDMFLPTIWGNFTPVCPADNVRSWAWLQSMLRFSICDGWKCQFPSS